MRIIRGHYETNLHDEIKRLEKEVMHQNDLLRMGAQSEKYKDDIIRSQGELIDYKKDINEKLRAQIEEMKLIR